MTESDTHFISSSASISNLSDIEYSTRGSKLIIGDHSFVDSFVKIKFVGGSGNIIIGCSSFINSGCVLYSGNGISIGNNVLIASNCSLAPVNHSFEDITLPIRLQGFQKSKGGITIDDDVWIGSNSVLLDGCHISSGAVVAAGSVVVGTLPPYSVSRGTPAIPFKFRN